MFQKETLLEAMEQQVIFSISRKAIGFAFVLTLVAPATASAITAEVARACDAAVAKAFPPKQIGNPAAGSTKGTAKQQRDYFNKCVENNGKVDDAPAATPKDSKPSK
ncbi:hypothetical protein [Bradyrhizobium sp. Ec3.3]|uniref:hypothetical protein n=1 Tax=Bradyrhizobium sp. Ec3.3 TaxID=189753 RepID=UPI000410A816|nr:hypothetical protein [Bradyrhizobium sp. Ec3.3]